MQKNKSKLKYKHMKQKILLAFTLFVPLLVKAQNSIQHKDSTDFDCGRYFYYMDVIRDYLSEYPIPKDLFVISIIALEDITKIKSKVIIEDYSVKWTDADYKQDMTRWIDWYVNSVCKIPRHQQKKLYQRYIPIKQRERYHCPCHQNSNNDR
jgi:hypothetical protein